jgi:sec-independent protein translocase protein TatC
MASSRDPEASMSFLEHLEELRRVLLRSILALGVAFCACWAFSARIYAFLAKPLTDVLPPGHSLAYTGLADPFVLYMKVALLAGIFLACPFVLWQVWRFVAPGLHAHERKLAAPFIVSGTALFAAGGAFGYYVAFPAACRFFISVGQPFNPVITIREFFRLEMQVLLWMGAIFELPVLIYFLSRIGLVTPRFLWEKFSYAVFIIFIIAAVITPPDVVSQLLMALPMVALYLIGIGVAWLFGPAPSLPPAPHAPPADPPSQ